MQQVKKKDASELIIQSGAAPGCGCGIEYATIFKKLLSELISKST